MKISSIALWVAPWFFAIRAMGQMDAMAPLDGPPMPPLAQVPAYAKTPAWLGQQYFGSSEYAQLEDVVANYMKADARFDDGRHSLYLLTSNLDTWFGAWEAEQDPRMLEKLEDWNRQFPKSALQPIALAMQRHAAAWRARGNGYSSTVTKEGWRLFREQNQRAWKILMDNKQRSSMLPTWYEEAISIGSDLDVPDATLRDLFDEGIRRHPGYYAIYFAYMQNVSPRWGGTWQTADKFVREQSAAKSNKEGDILYARLYWNVDQHAGLSPSFFKDSLVDWPRMRRGFEKLMAAHPRGARNYASFAAFACRAGDATTYAKLRPKLDLEHFADVAPDNVTIEVCDARFMRST